MASFIPMVATVNSVFYSPDMRILVTQPLINFKKASDKLSEHFATKGTESTCGIS